MNVSQTKKTAILRIINSEVRERNLDAESYREASLNGGDRNSIMKKYYQIRFAALLSVDSALSKNLNDQENYVSTAQCATYISSRNTGRDCKNSKEMSKENQPFEELFANAILALGAASTIFALWLFNGNSISSFFYLLLVGGVCVTLLIPSFLAKLNLFPYLSTLSLMCTLAAITSFGSGMKLMRDNPVSNPEVAEQGTVEALHSIQFGVIKNKNQEGSKELSMNSINITTN